MKRHAQCFVAVFLSALLAAACSSNGSRLAEPPTADAPSTSPQTLQRRGEWRLYALENHIRDEGNDPSALKRGLFYPVNRFTDLLDIIRVNLGFGLGAHVNAHATRAVQVGGGASVLAKLGMEGRAFGMFNETRGELSFLMFGLEHYKRTAALGPIPEVNTSVARDRLYLDGRPYTGIGGSASAAIFGAAAEFRPVELLDFLTGLATIDLVADSYPREIRRPRYNRLSSDRLARYRRVIFVTSKVLESPHLRAESAKGVAVYDHRARNAAFLGEIGVLMGRQSDRMKQRDFRSYMEERDYSVLDLIAEKLADEFASRTPVEVVRASTLSEFEDRKSVREIAREKVLRLPDYAGLCREFDADAVVDVRLLEWALYRDTALQNLRVRLNVECKVIEFPANRLVTDISVMAYDRSKRGGSVLDFAKDEGRLLAFESEQAVDVLVPILADRLLER